jgi:ribosomal protein S18 acetylase RimI-like enzyme
MMNPGAEYNIRVMTLADYGSVSHLFHELDVLHSDRLPWLFRRLDRSPRDESMFRTVLADERASVLLADAGEVAGFVHVVVREAPVFPLFVPQLRGLIENIYVAPDWRRRGLARSLMQAAEKWAYQHGSQGIDLNVYEFNEQARALFAAMGYSTLSRRMSKRGPR